MNELITGEREAQILWSEEKGLRRKEMELEKEKKRSNYKENNREGEIIWRKKTRKKTENQNEKKLKKRLIDWEGVEDKSSVVTRVHFNLKPYLIYD